MCFLWCTANTSFSIPKAGHIFAKVRDTNPNHHFSSLIVHNIFTLSARPHLLCTCLENSICFSLFTSDNPGRILFVYIQKSGWLCSHFVIVLLLHQSPVAYNGQRGKTKVRFAQHYMKRYRRIFTLARLANERTQFPPFIFCRASAIHSFMTP